MTDAALMARDPALAEVVRRLVEAYEPERIYLFGSVARGESGPDSDYDLYFSILQRKALTPADFASQDAVAARILGFQEHYQQIAQPFEWKFTRRDLDRLVARWAASEREEPAVAA